MKVGAKLFATVGGENTRSVPLAALPVPPLVELIGPVEFTYAPGVLEVTLTVIVHEDEAGTTPPESVRLAPAAAALTVPEQPAPLMAAAGVPVFTRPAG